MFPDLEALKEKREELNLTQREIAKQCGVSQSTIAKIESGSINPSYKIMRKIFTTLQKIKGKKREERTPDDIMTKEVVGVKEGDRMRTAIEKMKKNDYSQLPVFSKGNCVGSLSEETILRLVAQEKDWNQIFESKVEEYMEDAFPRVSKETPLTVIIELLKHSPAVLITQEGKIVGIISKADLLDIQLQSTTKE